MGETIGATLRCALFQTFSLRGTRLEEGAAQRSPAFLWAECPKGSHSTVNRYKCFVLNGVSMAQDYSLDPDEEWIACERCRVRLRPLAKYKPEDVRLGAPGLGPLEDMSRLGFRGLMASLGLTFLSALLSCIAESAATGFRRRKVAKLQREILPKHPKSLICPQCLKVLRRA